MLTASTYPRVAVLMATYNGITWLQAQLDSILAQREVNVTLYASDDGSNDGTDDFLRALSQSDARVVVLPKMPGTGSAGQNFYRLICDVNVDAFDYVAFADQDDIWHADKLARHIVLLKKNNAAAVSSNVIAFWPNGTERLILKSQPQRSCDFLFESAGPGCTFLMTPWLISLVREQLMDVRSQARNVLLHDWLTYAICRASGGLWVIDSMPSLHYRQHQLNVVGANSGLLAKWSRLLKFMHGWYRTEVIKVCQVCAAISTDPKLMEISRLVAKTSINANFRLILIASQARRGLMDRLVLVLCFLFFIF
jgi:rhamnosyltransferase